MTRKGSENEFVVAAVQRHLKLLVPKGATEGTGETALPETALERAQSAEGRALLAELSGRRPLGLYVSGLPGVGKSTLLLHLILADIRDGRACCVIDPHGDLVRAVLERCPSDTQTLRRILLFDPTDTDRPVGLDLLDASTEREQALACQFMLALYEELFLTEHQGPILHESLTNGMRLLMETGGSLSELPVLFTDTEYLRHRLCQCQNPWVRHYFKEVWIGMGQGNRSEYFAYFTSKLARFLDDPVLRNILSQKRGPDLVAHLNSGGVLLASLARGTVGDLNARLLGMILLHTLERTTLARAQVAPDERPALNVYVDEFHELVTKSLGRFLGAARKFNVGITLANQRLETLPSGIQEAVLGSVNHYALFRQKSGHHMNDLAGLLWPRYGTRELVSVPNYEALVRVVGAEGDTHIGRLAVPLPEPGNETVAEITRIRSRRQYGRPRRVVERETLERLQWTEDEEEKKQAENEEAEDEEEKKEEED